MDHIINLAGLKTPYKPMKKYIILVLAGFLIPFVSFASFDVSLKYGSKGFPVNELQDFLKAGGYEVGSVDGRFGLVTRKAVIAWQIANSLTGDGYFGLLSRAKAKEQLDVIIQPSLDAEQAETGSVALPITYPTANPANPAVAYTPPSAPNTGGPVETPPTPPAPVIPPPYVPLVNAPTKFFSPDGKTNIGSGEGITMIDNTKYMPRVELSSKLKAGAVASLEIDGHTYQLEDNGLTFLVTHLHFKSNGHIISASSYDYTIKLSTDKGDTGQILGAFTFNNRE